ncbi:protein-L-isoaspartate O-methyltransferase [Campylobacter sp. MIT 12-8780]|uniref:protein-L-isoaspartate(D-aspartate) O-methyltransferase n=1 Tax=unclassified Campylobacter TaxID=2593542 RepID=UPI00115CABE1|nr:MULTISPECIES: protein-L-isoaspartate(D-aspartate) O-methyltransferase [unclassified Campylobacter]NDJ27171.1 protein-L-isoaspartate(D-aspartate) O-methyltransferase [Campylobacter sp. MIT 19-121]TQR41533.1 protein-L-isoaspartate O-methyltransferase [Campylobacter sp. MIT 12-8780]
MTFFEQKRCKSMAEEIAEKTFINEALFNAFCSVPRELFSPLKAHAYSLNALPMIGNQWISSPLTVAKMTMALELKDVDNVLEIGCGSGYQAAILSKIVRRVFSVERIENLVESAKKTFNTLELHNILVLHADGQAGWSRYAPYDRILFSAYAQSIPDAIFEQLKDGGMLVAPMLINNKQFITRFYKKDGEIRKEVLEECLFVPVLEGKE